MRDEIKRIEIINLIIGLCTVLVCLLIYKTPKIPLSVAIGSVIGGANFWTLTAIFSRMIADNEGGRSLLGLFAALKFALLVIVLWAVIKWLPVSGPWLLVGLTTIIASIVLGHLFQPRKR